MKGGGVRVGAGASTQSSRVSSRNGSRRQSTTEDSIDSEDEWYKHEMKNLEDMEYEKKMAEVKPSASVDHQMGIVFKELTESVKHIEKEDCDLNEAERMTKAKKDAALPPPPPPPDKPEEVHPDPEKSDLEEYKKVIKRFEDSDENDEEEDDIDDDGAVSEESTHHAKRKAGGAKGRLLGSLASDSDATQSGPDSLVMESDEDRLKGVSAMAKHMSSKESLQSKRSNGGKSSSTEKSTGAASTKPTPSIKIDSPPNKQEGGEWVGEGGQTTNEWAEGAYEYSPGYYDDNGEWVDQSGYYDENGDWVETGGYYDENEEWIEYAGYYDDVTGEWVDVIPPPKYYESLTKAMLEYEGEGGEAAEAAPPDPGGGGVREEAEGEAAGVTKQKTSSSSTEEKSKSNNNTNNRTGSFLAQAGVAVNPQMQTTPGTNNYVYYYDEQGQCYYYDDYDQQYHPATNIYNQEQAVGNQQPGVGAVPAVGYGNSVKTPDEVDDIVEDYVGGNGGHGVVHSSYNDQQAWGDGEGFDANAAASDISPPNQHKHQFHAGSRKGSGHSLLEQIESRHGSRRGSRAGLPPRQQPSLEESETEQGYVNKTLSSSRRQSCQSSATVTASAPGAPGDKTMTEDHSLEGELEDQKEGSGSRRGSSKPSSQKDSPEEAASKSVNSESKQKSTGGVGGGGDEGSLKSDDGDEKPEEGPGLEEIMAEQKKSVGKARWEALGKSLKDRKDDLRAIVRH